MNTKMSRDSAGLSYRFTTPNYLRDSQENLLDKDSKVPHRILTPTSHKPSKNCRLGSKFIVWVVLTLQPSCSSWWMRTESSFLSSFFSNCLHRLPVSCYLWCCVAIVHSSCWPLLFHRDSIIFTTSLFQLGNSWKRWRGQSGKDQLGDFGEGGG